MPDEHPDREAWHRFLWRETDPELSHQMARHLQHCEPCLALYSTLSPPPPHWLGRPLPPGAPVPAGAPTLPALELVQACRSRWTSGGFLGVTSHQESSFYAILGTAAAQLRRAGTSVVVAGSPRVEPWVAPGLVDGVQILFPGPTTPPAQYLRPPVEGQVYVIARPPSEWNRLGVKPDLTLPSLTADEPACDVFEEALASGEELQRRMIALSGLGCDAPEELLERSTADPWMVPVLDPVTSRRTPWLTVRGDWTAQHFFQRWSHHHPVQAQTLVHGLLAWAGESDRAVDLKVWATRLELSARRWLASR